MNDAGETDAVAADELVPNSPTVPADGAASTANEDITHAGRLSLARALRLGQHLRIHVIVDQTGWLSSSVELVYQRARGNTIRPITVRVGRDARDDDVLADGGVLAHCRRYNRALDQLRHLGERLATLLRHGRLTAVPGSPIEAAHRELTQLDELIVHRQVSYMGNSVVRLAILRQEIEFFEGRHTHLAPIVLSAEQTACATWDGDTQELEPDEG